MEHRAHTGIEIGRGEVRVYTSLGPREHKDEQNEKLRVRQTVCGLPNSELKKEVFRGDFLYSARLEALHSPRGVFWLGLYSHHYSHLASKGNTFLLTSYTFISDTYNPRPPSQLPHHIKHTSLHPPYPLYGSRPPNIDELALLSVANGTLDRANFD